jgi:hypothetical protein
MWNPTARPAGKSTAMITTTVGKPKKAPGEDHDKQRDHGRDEVADHLEEERQMFAPFAAGEAGEPLDAARPA